MVVLALILHAVPTHTSNGRYRGEIHMKNRINRLLTTFVAVLAWSSSAYAGCNDAEFVGTWEVTFSDGNSCRLLLNRQGEVVANESRCYDPFRGSTAPDSGTYAVASDCSVNVNVVVEGVTVELAGQISRGRDTGAGRYLVPAYSVKGGFTLIRVP